jgi:hypothetical protein
MKLGFDPSQYQDMNTDFDPIPNGEYKAIIADIEEKTSRAGDNYLNLKIQIIDGENEGRLLWECLNLWHSNTKPKEIAEKTLATICRAVNLQRLEDTHELLDKPMLIKVKVTPPKGEYPAGNRITKWSAITTNTETKSTKKAWEQ